MSPTRLDRWLSLLPGLLLALVAVTQIHLAQQQQLGPWLGGGFGMFSTTDMAANRTLRVYLRRGAAVADAAVPPELERLAHETRMHPTAERLRELARRVAAAHEAGPGAPSGVRVEIWRRRFEPGSLEPRPTLVRQLEVPLGAG